MAAKRRKMAWLALQLPKLGIGSQPLAKMAARWRRYRKLATGCFNGIIEKQLHFGG